MPLGHPTPPPPSLDSVPVVAGVCGVPALHARCVHLLAARDAVRVRTGALGCRVGLGERGEREHCDGAVLARHAVDWSLGFVVLCV